MGGNGVSASGDERKTAAGCVSSNCFFWRRGVCFAAVGFGPVAAAGMPGQQPCRFSRPADRASRFRDRQRLFDGVRGRPGGGKDHLDQAKIIAKALIHRLSSGGESVAIVTASSPPREIIGSPIYDLKAAEDAVDRIEQSWGATDEAGGNSARDIARREPAQQPTRACI